MKKNTPVDYAVNVVALWGISTPNFWLGIMLIFLFAVNLGWLPASGYVGPFEDFWLSLQTTILPAFVLGNSFAAVLMRHTRSAMLQAMSSDYVRTARAKGLCRARRGPQARHAQCLDPGGDAGRARVRHVVVRRGADRAGVLDPGLRQADRRQRVQPRLRGGAGRHAGHGDHLHPAEPARRHRLRADQPAAAGAEPWRLPTR